MYVCMCACLCVCVCIIHTQYVCMYVRMYECMYVCMYAYTYIRMYVYTYIRILPERRCRNSRGATLAGPGRLRPRPGRFLVQIIIIKLNQITEALVKFT